MHGRWPVSNDDQVLAYVRLAGGHCPHCSYDLRGLERALCPECGQRITVASLTRPPWWDRFLRFDIRWITRLAIVLNALIAFIGLWIASAMGIDLSGVGLVIPIAGFVLLVCAYYGATFARATSIGLEGTDRAGLIIVVLVLVLQSTALVVVLTG